MVYIYIQDGLTRQGWDFYFQIRPDMAPLFAQGLAPGCGVSIQARARNARGILLVESGSNRDEAM